MEMIAIPMITLIKNKYVLFFALIIFVALFCVIDYREVRYVQQTLAALMFGFTGYLCKPLLDKYNSYKSSFKGMGWITLLIVAILSMYNVPVGMYINQYGNKAIFIITSILAIYSVFDIAVSLRNTSFIQWCGKASLILYILQFSIIRVVISICSKMLPSVEYSQYPCYIITFLIVMAILVPATCFCQRYCKFAFGR